MNRSIQEFLTGAARLRQWMPQKWMFALCIVFLLAQIPQALASPWDDWWWNHDDYYYYPDPYRYYQPPQTPVPTLIITVPGLMSDGSNLKKIAEMLNPDARVVSQIPETPQPGTNDYIYNVDMNVDFINMPLKGPPQSDWGSRQVQQAITQFRQTYGVEAKVVILEHSYGNIVGSKFLLSPNYSYTTRADMVYAFSPGSDRTTLNKMGEKTKLVTVTCTGDFHGPVHYDGKTNYLSIVIEKTGSGAPVSAPHNDMVDPYRLKDDYQIAVDIGGQQSATRPLIDVYKETFDAVIKKDQHHQLRIPDTMPQSPGAQIVPLRNSDSDRDRKYSGGPPPGSGGGGIGSSDPAVGGIRTEIRATEETDQTGSADEEQQAALQKKQESTDDSVWFDY